MGWGKEQSLLQHPAMFGELFQGWDWMMVLLLPWYSGALTEDAGSLMYLRTKWFCYHCDMEWDRRRFWVSGYGFISTCLNQQSTWPLCCAMNRAWVLGFHKEHWVEGWPVLDTFSFPDHCIWTAFSTWSFSSVFIALVPPLLDYSAYFRKSNILQEK